MRSRGIYTPSIIFSILFLCLILVAIFLIVEPLEKIAQYKDNKLTSISEELLDGIKKYESEKGKLPWSDDLGRPGPSIPLSWVPSFSSQVGLCKDNIECLELVIDNPRCNPQECKTPGELVEGGFIKQELIDEQTLFTPWKEIYLARGEASQDKIYACFVPVSSKVRKETSSLNRIDLDKTPVPSTLRKCDDNVRWFESDVCWRCVSK